MFETMLNFIWLPDHEGGKSMDPKDRGNWTGGQIGLGQLRGTNKGLSAAAYPALDIMKLSDAELSAIYRKDYWIATSCDMLPEAIAALIFDGAVNQGPGATACCLQTAVNDMGPGFSLAVDGGIGPKTRSAVNSIWFSPGQRKEFIHRIAQERAELYVQEPTVQRFGAGWFHRLFRCHGLALEHI